MDRGIEDKKFGLRVNVRNPLLKEGFRR